MSIIHEELQVNKKKRTQWKMGIPPQHTNLCQIIIHETYTMVNKNMKRCSTSIVIKEIQKKNTMKCYYTTIRIAKMENKEFQVLTRIWLCAIKAALFILGCRMKMRSVANSQRKCMQCEQEVNTHRKSLTFQRCLLLKHNLVQVTEKNI